MISRWVGTKHGGVYIEMSVFETAAVGFVVVVVVLCVCFFVLFFFVFWGGGLFFFLFWVRQ